MIFCFVLWLLLLILSSLLSLLLELLLYPSCLISALDVAELGPLSPHCHKESCTAANRHFMFAFEKTLLVQKEFNCSFSPTLVDYAAIRPKPQNKDI